MRVTYFTVIKYVAKYLKGFFHFSVNNEETTTLDKQKIHLTPIGQWLTSEKVLSDNRNNYFFLANSKENKRETIIPQWTVVLNGITSSSQQ